MLELILLVAFAVFFYRVAEIEGRIGMVWAILSVGFFIVGSMFGGFIGIFLVQGFLFLLMFALNALSSKKSTKIVK